MPKFFFVIENEKLKYLCDIPLKNLFSFKDKVFNRQRKMKILKI